MKFYTRLITKKNKFKFYKPVYLLLAFIVFCSHDLYIKMESYFLQPNQEATLSLYNGTFENSDNIITRDRMLDASVIAQGKRTAIDSINWKDQDSTITQLTFKTGEAGTYVLGVSTKARDIELTAEKFNSYLKSDGVFEMLRQRTNDGLLDQDAVENYQKHVKAIYQVGNVKSNDWNTVLGYPIEFVPQTNPYEKYSGETLEVQLLLDGKPLSNQLVFADYVKSTHTHSHNEHSHEDEHDGKKNSHEHSDQVDSHDHAHQAHSDESHSHNEHNHEYEHDGKKDSHEHSDHDDGHDHPHQAQSEELHSHNAHDHEHEQDDKKDSHVHSDHDDSHNHAQEAHSEEAHTHTSGQQLRTDDKGVITVELPEDGIYYLRTIHMTRATDSDKLTHRSKWATLTFGVSHSHDNNTHDHDFEQEDGVPIWIFILGSILIVGVLFLIFRKKG